LAGPIPTTIGQLTKLYLLYVHVVLYYHSALICLQAFALQSDLRTDSQVDWIHPDPH
jgi:hypothetical protein